MTDNHLQEAREGLRMSVGAGVNMVFLVEIFGIMPAPTHDQARQNKQ